MKRLIAFVMAFILTLGLSVPAVAVDEPLVPRSFGLEMKASLGEYNGVEYIVLDIGVVDITDPYGLLSVEFNIEFDGDKLVPLWQTGLELNGDGVSAIEGTNPPQMVTAWPTFEKSSFIPGYGVYKQTLFAVTGLCKAYNVTGSGLLNVNLLTLFDLTDEVVTEDNGMAVRLYFTPVDGFENGATYTFTVDGDYDVSYGNRADISVAGTSGLLNQDYGDRYGELRVYGYGSETTVTVRGIPQISEPSNDDESNDVSDEEYENSEAIESSDELVETTDDIISEDEEMSESESVEDDISDPSLHRPPILGMGDVGGDGFADSLDAAYILRHDSGLVYLMEDQLVVADVNGDGNVDSLDAARILKYDVGLIDSF